MGEQDLGKSDVPLTEDVVKKPPREFSSTFSEWAADNVEQIVKHVGSSGSGSVFDVPENFTFFITSASISIRCTSGAPGGRTASMAVGNGNIFLMAAIVGDNTADSNSISLPMPLRINSGESVKRTISANAFGLWSVHGFLLPKKISIR